MSFLKELAIQRAKFLEGLDANKGDINLDIFEDFYPDQAHFVFELLQNAEDAGATETAFTLSEDGCTFEHNGTRAFSEADVRAITGIHNSTKGKAPDQIGKFGVGFKSVFVYTQTPVVFSGSFSFKISRLVMPEPVEPDPTVGDKTRFWLPFDTQKKTPENAYSEIDSGLRELAETTLLFLSNIEVLRWQIGKTSFGKIARIQHSGQHFEMQKAINGQTTTSSHFLKFSQPVEGLEKQSIAVAYSLDFLPNIQRYDRKKPLSEQLRIVPAAPGQVAVYFPAQKEASGLRFHLHAPFVPELSRASIKESPANQPLFQQLAALSATSLPQIRDLGLLTGEFLAVLPNPQDLVSSRYEGIRTAIIAMMNTQPVTPTQTKSHAAAQHLLQASASLKNLLTKVDVEFLCSQEGKQVQWAIGATQKNSHVDRFLEGLAITKWDTDKFVELLGDKATVGSHFILSPPCYVTGPDQEFMNWISVKPIVWHQELYALLFDYVSSAGFRKPALLATFKSLNIVRRSDGSYSMAKKCFFSGASIEQGEVLPLVDVGVYTSGKSKTQQQSARKFLEEIEVREIGEAEQVEGLLERRYATANFKPQKQDLKRFITLVENDPSKASLFRNYCVLEGNDGLWHVARTIFIDRPYLETGLKAYHEALGTKSCVALAERYQNCGIALKTVVNFAVVIGASRQLDILQVPCCGNPDWPYLSSVGGDRRRSPIDRDYLIHGIDQLLAKPSLDIAKLLWRTMSSLPQSPDCLRAVYRKNERCDCRYADSQLVHHLRKAAWIPQGEGSFVCPIDASRDLLPDGFAFDTGWAWLKAIQFGVSPQKKSEEQRQKQVVAKELGFADSECLERAKRFVALPTEEQERILADQERKTFMDLPEHEPTNPDRRADRVGREAAKAPERRSEERTRTVSVGLDEVKQGVAEYLREQYTSSDGEMICQVCKAPLPFKLNDGTAYFEKIEFLKNLKKRHYQNYLALCPNHAAMFQYANGTPDLLCRFLKVVSNDLDLVLAQNDTTIYFTKTHILDLKTVIQADKLLLTEEDAG